MFEREYDAVVIGGGAAGMAAAVALHERGLRAAILEREEELGGILYQCIHSGFGLTRFGEELTGPEYAERERARVEAAGLDVFTETTALAIERDGRRKIVRACSARLGVARLSCGAIVLAMGCRERNRGNVGIPGARPAGVFTAGLAQRLINIDGYVPGRSAVIVGSGDIGLIMARRLRWIGARVEAVIEIMPYPSGTTRNIVQCLHDFDIPLYLSHAVTRIQGADRVEGVEVAPLVDGNPDRPRSFEIPCDTILLSVGLIPENELSRSFGVKINPDTGGPRVDADLMTNVDGVFACGNVLHVHDLVDWVSEEAAACGEAVSRYLSGGETRKRLPVVAGANVKYVVPNEADIGRGSRLAFRSMIVKNDAVLEARLGDRVVLKKKLRHVQPSEMIHLTVKPEHLAGAAAGDVLEISLR